MWLPERFRRKYVSAAPVGHPSGLLAHPWLGRVSYQQWWGFKGTLTQRKGRGLGRFPALPWRVWVHDCGGCWWICTNGFLSTASEGHLGGWSVFSRLKRGSANNSAVCKHARVTGDITERVSQWTAPVEEYSLAPPPAGL